MALEKSDTINLHVNIKRRTPCFPLFADETQQRPGTREQPIAVSANLIQSHTPESHSGKESSRTFSEPQWSLLVML